MHADFNVFPTEADVAEAVLSALESIHRTLQGCRDIPQDWHRQDARMLQAAREVLGTYKATKHAERVHAENPSD